MVKEITGSVMEMNMTEIGITVRETVMRYTVMWMEVLNKEYEYRKMINRLHWRELSIIIIRNTIITVSADSIFVDISMEMFMRESGKIV